MKIKIKKNFCETDELTLDKNDNIEIKLDKSDMNEIRIKGFVTDTRYAGAKVTIIFEEEFRKLLDK